MELLDVRQKFLQPLELILRKMHDYLYKQQFTPTSKISLMYDPGFLVHASQYRKIMRDAGSVHGRVLDFGCGSKPFESLFLNATEYIGVDTLLSSHDHSSSKIDVFYDGSVLPFPDQSFDCVLVFDVLEHHPKFEQGLQEVCRVLKPDGKIVGTIPFMFPEHEVPGDFRRLTSFGLHQVLSETGFNDLRIEKCNVGVAAILQILIEAPFSSSRSTKMLYRRILFSPFLTLLNLLGYLFLDKAKPVEIYSSLYFSAKKQIRRSL